MIGINLILGLGNPCIAALFVRCVSNQYGDKSPHFHQRTTYSHVPDSYGWSKKLSSQRELTAIPMIPARNTEGKKGGTEWALSWVWV